ncbi:MAG: YjjG family noncanonical pyrimidine nucleotidase [Clostridia bacterium]|nr:YjjG family noncanonical pyrimidine nucleotidase [Clostridia bacterium]
MIQSVLLDIDNTLLDFNKSAKETIKCAFNELMLKFSEEVFDTFLRVNNSLWRKIEKKEITRQQLHSTRWWIIFDELKINADGEKMERLFLSNLENYAIPVDGALDLVGYLSGKYKLYTASNAPYAQQVKRLTLSKIMPFINGILNFEAQGINKPQRQFFEQCVKAMSPVTSDGIAFIGDSLSADMKGGKSVGFTTVWFNYEGKDVVPPDTCDYTVKSLSEIKNIL